MDYVKKISELLGRLFSVKKDNIHLTYSFLGIKLKVNLPFNRKLYNKFKNHKIEPHTILIIEANNCHWEIIPGLVKYLNELGYNVEVLTRFEPKNIFQNNSDITCFECNRKTFDKIFNTFDFSKYERIIYSSKRVYFKKNDMNIDGYDLSEYFPFIAKGQKDNIYLQHHINKLDETPNDKQIVLANPSKLPELNNRIVDLSYYGDIEITPKNPDYTNFITVGELIKKRRNVPLLIAAIKKLHNAGYRNFNVTIIGNGDIEDIPSDIKGYFNILGRVDYPIMFEHLKNSDFILPLLDPDWHKQYLTDKVSGTFELIYGFQKPCIIHKLFADAFDFDDTCSLVYEQNDEFADKMIEAINLDGDKYLEMQSAIAVKADKLREISKNNLEMLLKSQ